MDKLPENILRFTEKLLYDQRSQDTAIMMLEGELQDLLDSLVPATSASVVDMTAPKGGDRHSQPEEYVIRLEENLQVKYLRGRIAERKRHQKAISEAVAALNEEEGLLVRLRYYERRRHDQCAKALHMWSAVDNRPSTTYWRFRQRLIRRIAKFIGLGE